MHLTLGDAAQISELATFALAAASLFKKSGNGDVSSRALLKKITELGTGRRSFSGGGLKKNEGARMPAHAFSLALQKN